MDITDTIMFIANFERPLFTCFHTRWLYSSSLSFQDFIFNDINRNKNSTVSTFIITSFSLINLDQRLPVSQLIYLLHFSFKVRH